MRLTQASVVLSLITAVAAIAPTAARHTLPGTAGTAADTFVGPSSSQTPYVVPSASGWEVVSLISAGDGAQENGYRMVGVPDGLGALAGKFEHGRYVADKAFMTLFMNHEIVPGLGIARDHGQNGAFVSQWTIHLNSLQIKRGEDLIQNVNRWDAASSTFVPDPTAQFSRFCSADLPAYTALYNPQTGRGFDGRLFMDGEESGTQGRAFAHVLTGDDKGTSYELGFLGRFSWENSLAHPNAGDKTIVVGLDDTSPGGEVYVYAGNKQRTGHAIARAGLIGGALYGIKVTNGGVNYGNGPVVQENAGPINGTFVMDRVTAPYVGDGAALQTFSTANGHTKFVRPEDGSWDTIDPHVFYFVVTGGQLGQLARLYKLTFAFDADGTPTGGTIELVVERALLNPPPPAGVAQFDNITVDGDGMVMVQEDPGGNAYLARTWRINPFAPIAQRATEILLSDPERFAAPTPAPFNIDEESSGIIEVTDIVKAANWAEKNRRYFFADMQAHYPIPGEIVEGGQLYLIASPKE